MVVEPNKFYRIYFNPSNINNKNIHVRAIVDNRVVVYKTVQYDKSEQYQMDDLMWFGMLHKDSLIKEINETEFQL